MIDFEEELKKFQPSLEVEDAEEAIYNHDLTGHDRYFKRNDAGSKEEQRLSSRKLSEGKYGML